MVQEIVSLSSISYKALVKLRVLQMPLDKELTVNCVMDICIKLRELILAAMVLMWVDLGTVPLRLVSTQA